MSRLDEVNKKIEYMLDAPSHQIEECFEESIALARTLAAEVDELRGKLDALRAEADPQALVICHMQGRAEGDEVITKLLATARDAQRHDVGACDAYRRACEIAGRTE